MDSEVKAWVDKMQLHQKQQFNGRAEPTYTHTVTEGVAGVGTTPIPTPFSEALVKDSVGDASPWASQVGGNHYNKLKIQPFEYSLGNNLGPAEHTAIKYVTRWKDKGGVKDLDKAIHTIQILKEWALANGFN